MPYSLKHRQNKFLGKTSIFLFMLVVTIEFNVLPYIRTDKMVEAASNLRRISTVQEAVAQKNIKRSSAKHKNRRKIHKSSVVRKAASIVKKAVTLVPKTVTRTVVAVLKPRVPQRHRYNGHAHDSNKSSLELILRHYSPGSHHAHGPPDRGTGNQRNNAGYGLRILRQRIVDGLARGGHTHARLPQPGECLVVMKNRSGRTLCTLPVPDPTRMFACTVGSDLRFQGGRVRLSSNDFRVVLPLCEGLDHIELSEPVFDGRVATGKLNTRAACEVNYPESQEALFQPQNATGPQWRSTTIMSHGGPAGSVDGDSVALGASRQQSSLQRQSTSFQGQNAGGNSTGLIDVVILGDGYQEHELGRYALDAQSFTHALFSEDPFSRFRGRFNVHRIDVISNQSGADHPELNPPLFVDTALGGSFGCNSVINNTLIVCIDRMAVLDAAAQAPGQDLIVVIMNDPHMGGASNGSLAMFTTGAGNEVGIHEVGHAFGLLADEYVTNPGFFSGSPPPEFNVTTETERSKIPWAHLIHDSTPIPTVQDLGVPGLYEGAKYFAKGIYRGTFDSKMRSGHRPFGIVNSELITNRILGITPTPPTNPRTGQVTNESGQGIDGVGITYERVDDDKDFKNLTTTDANGDFTTAGLISGAQYQFTPGKQEYIFDPPSQTVTVTGSMSDIHFTGTRVPVTMGSGRVTRLHDGTGMVGVTILYEQLRSGVIHSATTALNGDYEVGSLVVGDQYEFTPRKQGFVFDPASQTITATDSMSDINFTGTVTGHSSSGRIVNMENVGMVGVTIAYEQLGSGVSYSTTTDVNGYYEVGDLVLGDPYEFTPRKQGFVFDPTSQTVTVTGSMSDMDFTGIIARGSSSGQVTDDSGQVISRVKIEYKRLVSGITYSTLTKLNGRYAVGELVIGERYQFTPGKQEYIFDPPSQTVTVTGSMSGMDFTGIIARGSSSGQVTDDSGQGISGVTIAHEQLESGVIHSVTTDAQGRYEVEDLIIGAQYQVTPRKSGLVFDPTSQTITAADRASSSSVDFTVTVESVSASGRITKQNGQGLAGVIVSYKQLGTFSVSRSMTTDENGAYTINNFVSGTQYQFTPTKRDFAFSPISRTVTVTSSTGNINFTAATTLRAVSGRILDAQGNRIAVNLRITRTRNDGSPTTILDKSDPTNPQGRYVFYLHPGTSYIVTPTKSGHTFFPASRSGTLGTTSVTGVDFVGIENITSLGSP